MLTRSRTSPIRFQRRTSHRSSLRILSIFLKACTIAGLVCISMPSQAAYAAGPFTVNTTSDSHCSGFVAQGAPGCTSATDSGGHISLRSALEEANTAGGTTTITLPAGTFNLSLGDLVAGTQANTNITLQGAGAASTTIHQTTAGDMVILVNDNVSANVVFNLSGVTVSGGSENENDPDGFGGNGGAILAGGSASSPGNALNITNAVFTGNFCSPVSNAGCSGGAISMTGGGNLTVTGSTFSGNIASKNSGFGAGGAIYFDNGGNGGNVSITNSTFTNNTAQGNSTTGGQGGAIRLSGGAGTTYAVNGNTFTGNAANGTAGAGANGGAITLISGSMTASFNRIVGNSSASGSGLFVGNNAGTVGTATDNWWGCNGGPSAGPCDTAVLGTPDHGASMTVNPWIVLSNTASPNPILINQTATLTADFLHSSSAPPPAAASYTTSQIAVLLGLPVSWGSAVNGALSASQATIQSNGTATSTLTPSGIGAGSAGATVDNGTGTASITINGIPAFGVNPASANFGVVKVGKTSPPIMFTITNTGNGNMTIGSALTLAGPNLTQFAISANTCTAGLTLIPAATCTVSAVFKPTTVGAKSAYINVPDNATGSPHKIPLSGKGGAEQSLNGGFNKYPSSTAKIPTGWAAVNFGKGDGKNTLYKEEGTASVRIGNTSVRTKTLAQTRLVTGTKGSTFLLSLWAEAQSIPTTAGLVQAKVRLYNGATLLLTKTIAFPNGSYAFMKKSLSFTAPSAYNKIVITLTYSKGTGAVWFDALSLLRSP